MKSLWNTIGWVVVASAITVSAAQGASAPVASTPIPPGVDSLSGAANALNRLSEMKIHQEILAQSLKNLQIEEQIQADERKMNEGMSGVSSDHIPVVSLLTCSSAAHCTATLVLPNGARVSAYPGTVIGNGLTVVSVTAQGVLAASGSGRFYLPFANGVSGSPSVGKSGVVQPGSTSALPPPEFGRTPMNETTTPADTIPPVMPAVPTNFSGGMQ
jgi:hypothetical protein